MKVVFIATKDYANVGWAYMQALKSIGVDVQGFKAIHHRFEYPYELKIITKSQRLHAQNALDSADIIQVMHSSLGKMDIKLDFKKNIVVHHGGSIYREHSSDLNMFWNKRARATIIETPDLLRLGANNEYYVPAPVDTNQLCPKSYYNGDHPLRIAHYPSSAKMKGTNTIRKILYDLKKEFNFEILILEKLVAWKEHIERISKCDVYIDQLAPTLCGRKCCEYGVSTREAAALGKIVVSNHLGVADYNKIFGDTKILISNTPKQMKDNLKWLLGQSPKDIRRIQENTRNWIVSKHSYIPTGKMLESIYGKILTVKNCK